MASSTLVAYILLIAATILHAAHGIHWRTSSDAVWSLSCDFVGNDIGSQQVAGDLCSSTCSRTSRCTHFAWTHYNGGTCWMKSKTGVSQSEAITNNEPGSACGILRSKLGSSGFFSEQPVSPHSTHSPVVVVVWLQMALIC